MFPTRAEFGHIFVEREVKGGGGYIKGEGAGREQGCRRGGGGGLREAEGC